MDSALTARRVLARAAALAGGVPGLAERLEVAPRRLREHLTGATPIPDDLLLAAIDIVLEELPDPARAARAGGRDAAHPASES
ncbi:MAG: hypothetical protein ACT4P3_20400 [Betaproteobacteria bacterium]